LFLSPFRPMRIGLGVLALLAMAAPMALIYFFAKEQIVIRFLAPHQGFVCLRCHYALCDLPDAGDCPECGTPYIRADTITKWATHCFVFSSRARKWLWPADDADKRIPHLSGTVQEVRPTAPWSSLSLASAIPQVTVAAQRHGFRDPHFRSY